METTDGYHDPVMPEETLEYLIQNAEGQYLDATLGGSGHSRLILKRLNAEGRILAMDRDPEAISRGLSLLGQDARVTLVHKPFSEVSSVLGAETLDGALFDLGVSSRQLDARERGFSFAPGTSLDMRMDTEAEMDADEWIRSSDESELTQAFSRNSDLPRSRQLARTLQEAARQTSPLTSDDLRAIVEKVYRPLPQERNGILARVFQAIRMEVNGELREIAEGLRGAVMALKKGGRLVVLSYHSAEDRAVKETIAEFERDCLCPKELPICRCGGNNRRLRKVVRKPLLAKSDEVRRNPRARSAKLRVVEKV
jgi:16S rRNA (cytosine1402-N4)-methyltransferase